MSNTIPTPTPEQIEEAIWPADAFQKQPDDTFQVRFNALLDCTGVSYRQIERGTRGVVRQNSVWRLRTGRSKNPSYKIVAALSKFFNIPASYFFGDTCNDIAYLLPCIDETGRRRVEKLVSELLEVQLFQFAGRLSGDGEQASSYKRE